MDAFERELMRRSPLAGCVLEVCDHMLDDSLLESIWAKHRGRCYQDVLRFDDFLRLMREALIRHGGSAHKLSSWSVARPIRSTRATSIASSGARPWR
jgi:hypothetical protein